MRSFPEISRSSSRSSGGSSQKQRCGRQVRALPARDSGEQRPQPQPVGRERRVVLVLELREQIARLGPIAKAAGRKIGIRINPGYSKSTLGGNLYDPCSSRSRFGILSSDLDALPWDEIDILHQRHHPHDQRSAGLQQVRRVLEVAGGAGAQVASLADVKHDPLAVLHCG